MTDETPVAPEATPEVEEVVPVEPTPEVPCEECATPEATPAE